MTRPSGPRYRRHLAAGLTWSAPLEVLNLPRKSPGRRCGLHGVHPHHPHRSRDASSPLISSSECKRYSAQIKTPEMAYKFLQIDMLPPALRPDHFVLISNASMASILRDIIEFRKVDRHVKYTVHAWTNESSSQSFNHILLSYPQVYEDALARLLPRPTQRAKRLREDFRRRAAEHVRDEGTFFETLQKGVAAIGGRAVQAGTDSPFTFVLDQMFRAVALSSWSGWRQVIVASPTHPVAGLYDFRDGRVSRSIILMLERWKVNIGEARQDRLTFFLQASIRNAARGLSRFKEKVDNDSWGSGS